MTPYWAVVAINVVLLVLAALWSVSGYSAAVGTAFRAALADDRALRDKMELGSEVGFEPSYYGLPLEIGQANGVDASAVSSSHA
jgi:hypothetical protein